MVLLKTSPEDIYQTIMSYTTPHEEKNCYFPTINMKNQKYRKVNILTKSHRNHEAEMGTEVISL